MVRKDLYRFTLVALEKELGGLFEDIRNPSGKREEGVENMERWLKEGEIWRLEASRVVAESVASWEEAELAKLLVKLPKFDVNKRKRRRLEKEKEDVIKEVLRKEEEEVLIALLGPKAEYGDLVRRVGKESVFAEADPR